MELVSAHLDTLVPVTLIAAAITLPTGFGLATILTPVFLLFFDVKSAIFLVAAIHFVNNLFKLRLFLSFIDWNIIRRFGVASLMGALLGAFLFTKAQIPIVQGALGVILIFIGMKEFIPILARYHIPERFDRIGGFLSGLIGGLVGNQGAIRSAYLLEYNLTKETFIASAAMIALLIDSTRLPFYAISQREIFLHEWQTFAIVAIAAILGTFVGKQFLRYLKLEWFRRFIAGALIATGILLFINV